MPDWISVIYHFFDQEYPDCETFEHALAALADQGWKPTDENENEVVYWPSEKLINEKVNRKRASQLLADITHNGCIVNVSNDGLSLKIEQVVGADSSIPLAGTPHVKITTSCHDLKITSALSDEQRQERQFRQIAFATALSTIATHLNPRCGYGADGSWVNSYGISEKEVQVGVVNKPFKYMLIGEQAVKRIGTEKVHGIPYWYADELSNGSVLIILAPPANEIPQDSKNDIYYSADECIRKVLSNVF